MLAECTGCEARVDATVLYQHVVTDDFAPSLRYSLAQCPGCRQIVLLQELEDFNDWGAARRLYPPEDPGLGNRIPAAIEHAFEEAQSCARHGNYTAAALMCRRALECIADEHGIRVRNLNSALQQMREKGIIEARLFQWADALRIVGNDAAHALDRPVTAEDARDTIDFTRALIEYVFSYHDKFVEFMSRRQSQQES